MDEIYCEGYDLELVPKSATEDKKTGVTIKGSESGYLEAHKMLKDLLQKKGDRFLINGIEIGLSDMPKNKPIIVEVKKKASLSGKVNLTIFEVNKNGGATIMVSKIKGGDPKHVRILGIEVIKYFLDGFIEGTISGEDLSKYKIKNQRIVEKNKKINCQECEQSFQSDHGLKIHLGKVHISKGEKYCDVCRITVKTETEFKAHMELEHEEVCSPKTKKRRRDTEDEMLPLESIKNLTEPNLKHLEEKSWEEIRMKHREIEIQVNEEELLNMKEYDADVKNGKVQAKIEDMEMKEDQKVLEKQRSWFEEEVKYQEMKIRLSEERIKGENKRKRQLSIAKK